MMAFCIVGKTYQSLVILALISYDPCANQMRSLRYRPMRELPEARSYDNDEG